MISANAALVGSYDYGEVARSVLIAIAASYAALDLAGRVTAARGRIRLAWLSGGAVAMGLGIWAMHFKGMLAFHLPVPVEYHWPTVLASLLVAIFASAFGLYVASRQKMGWREALTGSVIMGAGIAGLHYISMAAMRLPAITRYSPLLVTASILLAALFCLIALLMAFDLREETRWSVPRRLGSAIVMGAAVSAMHYTGMAAANFIPAPPPDLSHAVSISPVGNSGIAIVTLIVIVAAIVTSSVDRRASAEIQRLNQELERRVAERTLQLETANQSLRKEIAERERAEGAVRRSEEHLRLVIDTIPQRIWSGAPDGSLDFFNAQWRSYTGLTREELQGEGWQRMLHPGDRERVLKAWHESVISGTPFEQEVRHRRADGQYRWFLVRGVPLRDSEGRIVRWYGTSTDIEDRKRAEDAVRRSEEHLRLVIDTAPAMLHSARPDGYLDFFNKRWLEYVGISLDDLLGWRWTNVFHPEDVENVVGKWRSSVATGKPFEAEARLRRADGEYRLMLLRKVPLRDDAGSIVKWYGSGIDIEDRKRAEEELRQAQTRTESVLESVSDTHILFDRDWHYLYVNRAAMLAMGRPREQILGRTLWELYPDIVGTELERQYRYAMEKRIPVALDFHYPATNTWWENRFYPAPEGLSVFATDITEPKRAEQALQEAQSELARVTRVAAMGELAAAIAHEVNQPLGAVVTNASASLRWLAGQPPNLEEARDATERTVREANRASDVIRRIRALLQKGPPQMEQLDVNAVIREVLTLAGNELLRGGVAVQTELAPDVPNVLGDRVQLQQGLLNLILNGIDSMSTITGRPRDLLIRSVNHPEGVLIEVHDSGVGVDPERADSIFEPFFTTKPQGIGMGLSIGRSIIEAHGGRLWFTPGSPHGAVFQFTLPKAD